MGAGKSIREDSLLLHLHFMKVLCVADGKRLP